MTAQLVGSSLGPGREGTTGRSGSRTSMAGKMRLLQPLPSGWLLTGSGALVLWPSALTLLVVVLQAAVVLLAIWVPAWRQARGQDRARKLVETMGETPTVIVVGADGRIEIRYDHHPSGGRSSGEELGS